MDVTKQWLDAKIASLNQWLSDHQSGIHFEYAEKKHNRDYYVKKLIDLEESKQDTIRV